MNTGKIIKFLKLLKIFFLYCNKIIHAEGKKELLVKFIFSPDHIVVYSTWINNCDEQFIGKVTSKTSTSKLRYMC